MSEINTSEFMAAFDRWVATTEQNAEQAFRALVLDIFRNIQIRTPVDTGRARGNWQVEFNGTQEATIYNNLPYIERLENGWSQQAPAGFVRVTLSEFERKLNQAARDNQL
jgi:hypothetical protein